MIQQLDVPLPMITPKGSGLAHFIIDYGIEHNLMFVVFLHENGECWTFDTRNVRMEKNVTIGRLEVGNLNLYAYGNGKQ
jgi:hypothetical protein